VKIEYGIDTARHLAATELKLYPGMGHDLPATPLAPMLDRIYRTATRA